MFNSGYGCQTSAHCQTVADCQALMVHDSVAASEELRSIAEPESRRAPRSTWTVSRCPGDLHLSYAEQNTWSPWHILTCVWKSLYGLLSLLCTLRRPLQAAQHQKKAPASVASMGWRVYLRAGRCSSAASEDWPLAIWKGLARQPSNRSRLSWIHGTFTGCHSWFFSKNDMVTVCSIERQVVQQCLKSKHA